jgi:hypothetical protein
MVHYADYRADISRMVQIFVPGDTGHELFGRRRARENFDMIIS